MEEEQQAIHIQKRIDRCKKVLNILRCVVGSEGEGRQYSMLDFDTMFRYHQNNTNITSRNPTRIEENTAIFNQVNVKGHNEDHQTQDTLKPCLEIERNKKWHGLKDE